MMPSLSETGSISASRHRSTARLIGPSGVTARLSPRSGKAMPGSNIDACSLWVEKHRLDDLDGDGRSEEHTSELQSLMRISYAVFCLKKTNTNETHTSTMMAKKTKNN